MNATAAAYEINALYLETVSAYVDDETLIITLHTADRARLETGSIALTGSAIATWYPIVKSLA